MDKKLHFKSLLLVVALLLGGGNSAWADEVETITFSTLGYENGAEVSTVEGINVNLTLAKGTNANNTPKYYTTGSGVRLYNGNTMQIKTSSSFLITKIVFTFSASGYTFNTSSNNQATVTAGAYTEDGATGTWEGSTNDFTISSTKTCRLQEMKITLASASDTRTATSIAFSGTYPTVALLSEKEATLPTAIVLSGETPVDGTTITWESEDETIAKIEDNKIKLIGSGSVELTASFDGNDNYKPSSKKYKLIVCDASISSLEEMQTKAVEYGSTKKYVKITFANVKVSYSKSSSVYLIDNSGFGALIYGSKLGLNSGDIINGTTVAQLYLYCGMADITSFSKEGLEITEGTSEPIEKGIDAITKKNYGMLVTIKNVTYDKTNRVFKDGNDNSIVFYDAFGAGGVLSDGDPFKEVTGIILLGLDDDNNPIQIAPRTGDDLISNKKDATACWYTDNTKETVMKSNAIHLKDEGKSFVFDTNSDGAVVYSSSNVDVATIADDGTITPKAKGATVITALTHSTTTYNAATASFTLTVSDEGTDFITATAINANGYTDWSDLVFGSSAKYSGNSTTHTSGAIQMRNSNSSGIVTTTSGGRAKKVSVIWNSATQDDRSLSIYGKNTAYESAADLYNNDNRGNLIGTIVKGISEVEISGNYAYIGIRSANGALYLDNITVEWDEDAEIAPEVTIGNSKLATFAHSKTVDFTSSGLTAYTATVEGSVVKLTAVEGNIVPANTGVIVKAEKAGSYAGLEATGGSVSDNELVGVTAETAVSYNDGEKYNYILQNGAFYKANGATLKANRAYLSTTFNVAAGSRLTIVVDGETTGIKTVKGDSDEQSVYDLQGRKVAQPVKGLYITNGKKFIVK